MEPKSKFDQKSATIFEINDPENPYFWYFVWFLKRNHVYLFFTTEILFVFGQKIGVRSSIWLEIFEISDPKKFISIFCLTCSHLKIQIGGNFPLLVCRTEFFSHKKKLDSTKWRPCFVALRTDFSVKNKDEEDILLNILHSALYLSQFGNYFLAILLFLFFFVLNFAVIGNLGLQ